MREDLGLAAQLRRGLGELPGSGPGDPPAPLIDRRTVTHHAFCAQRVLFISMRTLRPWLYAGIAVTVLAMVLLPYTLLTGVNAWYGSFLLWTVGAAAVLVASALLSFGWED
ncbi:hypothetical protein [Nesterenkonia pannonica]|uniref:hypothetical protein n=2 Tax=Nesterenkonia TaxID=57494 RepID=UPI0021641EA6|nr:hypothetical protein [Nesterenkonia pannonica]